jgi:hypothetical protein
LTGNPGRRPAAAFQVRSQARANFSGAANPAVGKTFDLIIAGLLAQAAKQLDRVMTDARFHA